jgi:cardiolipin synthase (CMP-forming)
MTVPNLLTLARISLTPVVVWLVLHDRLNSAFILFFLAGMTDAADGFIARYFNQKSRFGAYIDPVADKILLVSLFITLWYVGLVPLWLLVITTGRDLMIVGGVSALYFSGIKVEMHPLVSSKATTFFQLLTVFLLLGSNLVMLPGEVYTGLFLVTAGFSIFSAARYFFLGLSLHRRHRSRSAEL